LSSVSSISTTLFHTHKNAIHVNDVSSNPGSSALVTQTTSSCDDDDDDDDDDDEKTS
jgi:hypothetical protein